MICPGCEGEGLKKATAKDGGLLIWLCPECGGKGIASCCDTAGAPSLAPGYDPYVDDRFPERNCNHCGQAYQGPAVYCSYQCAEADA